MKIIEQSVDFLEPLLPGEIERDVRIIEKAMRNCYQSWCGNKTPVELLSRLFPPLDTPWIDYIQGAHHSVLEHRIITVIITTDRGVTHEEVRHRVGSYSQESQRYCDYSKQRFDGTVVFIKPTWLGILNDSIINNEADVAWHKAMEDAEKHYFNLLKLGWTAEQARAVLPNSAKTAIVTTFNYREWRWFFALRCGQRAHPQMRDIAMKCLKLLHSNIPLIFDDLAAYFKLTEE